MGLRDRVSRWLEKKARHPGNDQRISDRWIAEYALTYKPEHHGVVGKYPARTPTAATARQQP